MLKIQIAFQTIHMIGNSPNAAPSRPVSSAWPTRHRIGDNRDQDRRQQRQQTRPVRLQPESAEQHEQRRQRDHRDERAEEQRTADGVQYLLVHLRLSSRET
jgi:hypothetical protein